MAKKNPLKNWLSIRQFAEHFQVSKTTISNAIKAGTIEAYSIDRDLYIHKNQFPAFKQQHRTKFHEIGPGHYKVTPARGRKPNKLNKPSVIPS